MDPIQYISEKIDDVPMISIRSLAHELLINIKESKDALEKFIKSSTSKDIDVCYIVTGIKKSSQENNFSETCGVIETNSQYVQEKDIDKVTKLLLPNFRKSIYAIRKKTDVIPFVSEGPFGIGKFHQAMTIDSTDHLKTLGYIFNPQVHKIKALDRNRITETKIQPNTSTNIKPKMETAYSLPPKDNNSKATSQISGHQKINTEPIQTPKSQESDFTSQTKKPYENSTQPSTIKENISKKGIMGFFTKKEPGSHGNPPKDSLENITPKKELEARVFFPLEDASREDLNNNQTNDINLNPKEGDTNIDIEGDVDSEDDLIDVIDTKNKKTRGRNLEPVKKKGSKETKKKVQTSDKRKNNLTESKRETLTSKNKRKGPKKEDEVNSLNIPSDDDDDFMNYRPKMNNKLLALDDSEDEEQSSLDNFSQPSSPIHEVNNKPISSFLQAKPESKPQYIVGSDGKKRKRLVTKEKVKKMIGKKLVVEFQDVSEYVTEEEEETPKPSQGILQSSIESKIDESKSLKEFKQETKAKTKQSDITNFFKPKKN